VYPLDVPLADLRTRTSEKWRHYPNDVLPLFVAEMDVHLPPPVADVLTAAVTSGDTGYGEGRAYPEAFAGFAARRWGWHLSADAVRVVPNVMTGVVEVVRLVTEPGAAVVVDPPVYPPFRSFVKHAGRRVVGAPLGPDGRLDLDRLATTFAQVGRGSVFLLCQPHNPTGTLHTAEELTAVGDLARRHGVQVVADEIHAPLVLDGRFVPTTTVGPEAVALHSASKAFNLAGLPAALAVPGPEASATLARLSPLVGAEVGHLSALAQTAALRDADAWLDGLLTALRANAALLGTLLAEHVPSARWTPPQATYLAWLDLRQAAPTDADPARRLLETARVAVNPGLTFGAQGAGHVRLNFATSPTILTEAVRRIGQVFGRDQPVAGLEARSVDR
jgi:cystathionine beta-lyase